MKTWMWPWLLPLGLVLTVIVASLSGSLAGIFLSVIWGLGLFPILAMLLRSWAQRRAGLETDYWRLNRR